MTDYSGLPADYVEIGIAVAKILFAIVASSAWAYTWGYKRGRRSMRRTTTPKPSAEPAKDVLLELGRKGHGSGL